MSEDFNIEEERSLSHDLIDLMHAEVSVDILVKRMALMLLFGVRLDCRVFWTLG